MTEHERFCSPENYQVLIPYSDLVKMVEMANNFEKMEKQMQRIEEQYTAIRGMFAECLDKIRDIQEFVKD